MIPKRFQKMIGHAYLYMGNELTIRDIVPSKTDDDLFVVKTDAGRSINCTSTDLRKDFMPAPPRATAVEVYRELDRQMPVKDLVTILEENITKVKADPSYLPQAKAVNDSAKQIIEVRKVQVEIAKLVHASGRL